MDKKIKTKQKMKEKMKEYKYLERSDKEEANVFFTSGSEVLKVKPGAWKIYGRKGSKKEKLRRLKESDILIENIDNGVGGMHLSCKTWSQAFPFIRSEIEKMSGIYCKGKGIYFHI